MRLGIHIKQRRPNAPPALIMPDGTREPGSMPPTGAATFQHGADKKIADQLRRVAERDLLLAKDG